MPAPVQLVPRGSHGFEFGGVPLPLLVDDPLSLWMHDLGSLEASELKPACSWVEVDCTIVSEYLRHLGGFLVCPTTNYAICFHPDANKQPAGLSRAYFLRSHSPEYRWIESLPRNLTDLRGCCQTRFTAACSSRILLGRDV